MVYLIEELCIDPMENDIDKAMFYEVVGYAEDENKAQDYIIRGGFIKSGGWPFKGEKPRYRCRTIRRLR